MKAQSVHYLTNKYTSTSIQPRMAASGKQVARRMYVLNLAEYLTLVLIQSHIRSIFIVEAQEQK